MILQPNCSELVTDLGCKKIDEVSEVLEKVKQLDDYTLVALYRLETPEDTSFIFDHKLTIENKEISVNKLLDGLWNTYILIPLTGISIKKTIKRSQIENGTVKDLELDREKLIKNFDLSEDEKFLIRNVESFNKYRSSLQLVDGDIDGVLFGADSRGPEFNMDCYSLDTLNMELSSDYAKDEFPALVAVMDLFNSDYQPFDGGHTKPFEDWLEANGMSDKINSKW